MNTQVIATNALENLQKATQIKGKWKNTAQKDLDGQVELLINGTIKLNAEIKNDLRAAHLPQLFLLAKQYPELIIIANKIFPKLKEELRTNNIAYLEGNGNIWLKHHGTLLWIDNNKPVEETKEKINRAFTKAGLKAVFLFLLDENLINAPYREIAQRADIALGNVNYVINGLKEKGFLHKVNKKEFKFTNKKDLLNTWIINYGERLKPELEIGTFRFLKQEDFLNWKNLPIKNNKTWWGGEPGGNLLTNYLKPGIFTLYTLETKMDLIKNYRLIPDPNGNIKVYNKFWDQREVNDNVVPPLLVYADLINTGDYRCIETANKIYDEFLKEEF